MKRRLALLLSVLLCLSLFPTALAEAEDPFAPFAEEVEIHIGMGVDPADSTLPAEDSVDDNFFTRYLKDTLNIKVVVDWTAAGGDGFNQKVSLCIASNSLPDALVLNNRAQFIACVESDMLYDLSEVYDKYAASMTKAIYNTSEGKAMDAVTIGGKMLALPIQTAGADGVHVMFIQQNWLDELGLKVPQTVEEIYETAKAFKEAGLAGSSTIPILGAQKDSRVYTNFLNSANARAGFEPIFSAMKAYPGYFLMGEDGKVTYGTLSAQMRDALELLAGWYAEGLIDPEFATRDYYTDPINANSCGIFFGPWWSIGYGNGDSFKNNPDVNWQSYPVFADDGTWNVKMKNVGDMYTVVNKNVSEEVAEAVIKMNNICLRDETRFDSGEFPERKDLNIEWFPLRNPSAAFDDVEFTYDQLIKILNGEASPDDYLEGNEMYKLLITDVNWVDKIVTGYEKDQPLQASMFDFALNESECQRLYSILIGDRPYATTPIDNEIISLVYETNSTIDRYWANLEALEDAMVRSIITGNADITAFDTFVEQWLNEGGQKILDSVQEYVDSL